MPENDNSTGRHAGRMVVGAGAGAPGCTGWVAPARAVAHSARSQRRVARHECARPPALSSTIGGSAKGDGTWEGAEGVRE